MTRNVFDQYTQYENRLTPRIALHTGTQAAITIWISKTLCKRRQVGCSGWQSKRLRGKLRTDSERIQRDIEEYNALSQQVMQLTKTVSESVEKVRASVDRQRADI